jgi:1,4-dihydroxy-2-naphthoate octaprenyltransferase
LLKRATLLHLRIPFSIYLAPVFCFAVSCHPGAPFWKILLSFFIIHFLLYPASNGYNSYFDKDEESIGGLEHPPPVDKELYYVSLALDGIAIALGFILGWRFALMLFIYGLVSKAYSHPSVRLKKYPVISLLAAAIFQGGFTFLMVSICIWNQHLGDVLRPDYLFAALLSSLMILGFYPMTQVYQHGEDGRRGDLTFSRLLGIKGTFIFSALIFLIADAGFVYYFNEVDYQYFYFSPFGCQPIFDHYNAAIFFQICLLPMLGYFLWWASRVWKDPATASFRNTMRLNLLASVCLILFFIIFGMMGHCRCL